MFAIHFLISSVDSSKRLGVPPINFDDERVNSKNNEYLFYDMHVADYETVLTPADFEMALEINDYPYNKNSVDGANSWDSEAM
jgi:hypothetical protein